MPELIQTYLKDLKIGGKQEYLNLALFPLLSPHSIPLDYLTLDEALEAGVLEVKEVSEGGSVPELRITNTSPKMILILDGEELVGAKQNRVVNTTILVKEDSLLTIPVSCVEQGRWSYAGRRFASGRKVMSGDLRAKKAQQMAALLRSTGEYRSDQGAIWDEIELKARRRSAVSPSMAMSEIYEKERPRLEEYLRHFRPIEGQLGGIFLINGKVAGLEGFGKPETFTKVFKKLLQSYALDAIDWYDPEKEIKSLKSEVTEFLSAANAAQIETRPSVGLGTDFRLESRKVTGFALALEDQVLHFSIFFRPASEHGELGGSRMARFSNRNRRNK